MLPRYFTCTAFGAAGCLLLLAGCSGRDVEQIPVAGTVTLDGGPLPGPGTLFFNCVEAAGDAPKRPGTAEFGVDGKYAAGTFAPGDGLIPGKYRVAVHCWEVSPNEEDVQAVSYIPEKYNNPATSGLELVVPEGESSYTYDVPLKSE